MKQQSSSEKMRSLGPPIVTRTSSPDNDHGNRFQTKLLFLLFIRAIILGYRFNLGTELENFGGKFDDLIFLKDYGQSNQSFLYLQAKHRLYETPHPKAKKITAADLLNDNKGDFSLIKYFHSFCDFVMKAKGGPKGEDKVDCVISTNVDFDLDDLVKNGIQLKKLSPDELNDLPRELLTFKPVKRQTIEAGSKGKKKKTTKETNNLWFVANYLRNWAQNANSTPGEPSNKFQTYFDELLSKNAIVSPFPAAGMESMRFHPDFIDDSSSLSEDAKKLRNIIVNLTKNDNWEKWEFPIVSQKIPNCYRLKSVRWLEMHFVANVLRNCAENPKNLLDRQSIEFRAYQAALVKEKVLIVPNDSEKKTMVIHPDFINGVALSPGAKALRNIIDKLVPNWTKWTFRFESSNSFEENQNVGVVDKSLDDADTLTEIDNFFNNNLLFAVNTPNEEELNPILEEEIGKNEKINLSDTELHSSYILGQMNKWFKKEKNVWLTAEEGEKILIEKTKEKMDSLRATSRSLDYQEELKSFLSFNEEAVKEMAEKLKQWLASRSNSGELEVTHIDTPSPKLTAVKVIAALKHQVISEFITPNYNRDDSYLVTSSNRLNKKGKEMEWIRKVLTKEGNPHGLLVVVCDDESKSEEAFINKIQGLKGKRVIIIGKERKLSSALSLLYDTIIYGQLSDESKSNLLSKTLLFQRNLNKIQTLGATEKETTVAQLIQPEQCQQVLDAPSIEELMLQGELTDIEIPSYSATAFEQSLYIDRKVRFDFDFNDSFWGNVAKSVNKNKTKEEPKASPDELQKQCKINSSTGRIEWEEDIGKDLKSKIWKKIVEKTRTTYATTPYKVDNLIREEKWRMRAMIIAGVAGTGKSTVLSHFYDEIKKENPDHWVIRIDLKYYSNDLENYKLVEKTTKLPDVIDFIARLPTVVDSQSPFAMSLLRHRLETGDRVVLMLDGYDELNSECQRKVTLIIKTLEEKSVQLYVTTRPHMVDELQFELGQLAYTLQHFKHEDQIKCMTSFWLSKFNTDFSNGMKTLTLSDQKRLTGMAESIIDGLSADLKDTEESFIGIPLQCRILAECFLEQVRITIENRCERTPVGLPASDITDVVKNVASLYRRLMEVKRDIFLREKGVIENSNPIVSEPLDFMVKQIKRHLTELAIRTIVSDETLFEMLWPPLICHFQSDADRQDQVKQLDALSIRFGLVDRVDSASNVQNPCLRLQFLHRTYAEYFVADYLYQGFQLDDNLHNKLLDNESVRKLIVDTIFVKDEYNDVCVFLGSMLKEMTDSFKWKQIINQKEPFEKKEEVVFPERLQKIVDIDNSEYIRAIKSKNSQIFVFLFDCLRSTSNQTKIKQIVEDAFYDGRDYGKRVGFDLYYKQSNQVFERLMENYDASDEDKVFFILNEMLRSLRTQNCIEWKHNRTERDKILELLFNFMAWAKENGRLNKFLDPNVKAANRDDAELLRILICKDGYESRLKQYLDVYLNVYCDNDDVVVDLLTKLFKRYENDSDVNNQTVTKRCSSVLNQWNGKIKKVLISLQDHRRDEVLKRISRFVLKRDPVSFQDFYKPKEPAEEDALVPEHTTQSLLNQQDSAGMTRLHRAVYHSDTRTVDEILKWILDNKTDPNAKDFLACENKGFTPFYVAYSRGYREIGTKILECLNRIFSKDELEKHITGKNGFLHLALKETFIFDELEIMEWILTEIQRIFGSDLLVYVLKSDNCKTKYIKFDRPREKFIEVVANLVTDQHSKKECYKKVSDFVFLDADYVKKMLKCTAKDTLEKMIEADEGIIIWIKRFLNYDKGFRHLNRVIESGIIELNDDVFQQLVENGKSTVEELCNLTVENNRAGDVMDFLQFIGRNVGQKAVKEVILHNDGASITQISLANYRHGEISDILKFLHPSSDAFTNALSINPDIVQRIIQHANRIIPDILRQPKQPHLFYIKCMDMLPLVTGYASAEQLGQFVSTILLKPNGRYRNIWSEYLEDKREELRRRRRGWEIAARMENDREAVDVFSHRGVEQFMDCVSQKLGDEAKQRLLNVQWLSPF